MTLAQYLADHGISPAAFAETVNVDRATIYRLKGSEQIPSRELMDRIFQATGGKVQANDFYGQAA